MTTDKVTQEWRAVAPSGRVVMTFGSRRLARAWVVGHPLHKVTIRLVTIIEQADPFWEDK